MEASEFSKYMDSEREKVNKYILQLFQEAMKGEEEPYLRRIYKFGSDFVLRGGRRILPISLVSVFKGLSSDKDIFESLEDIYKASVSVELLHISSLVINDLVDHDELRGGLPTFHKDIANNFAGPEETRKNDEAVRNFIESSTLYSANLIAYLGTQVISNAHFDNTRKTKAMSIYQKGIQGVTRGHLLNEYYKILELDQITLENYLILADLKRGMQMATAVGVGSVFGNARKSQTEPLMLSMNKIGIIEQLVNDYRGSFGDPTKKSIDSDIRNGQATILTVIAYQSANPEQRKILDKILGNSEASKDEIEDVRNVFRETGAVDFVNYYSNSLKNDAYNRLMEVYPGLRDEIMDYFEYLLSFITQD